jgi:hypothetical protein
MNLLRLLTTLLVAGLVCSSAIASEAYLKQRIIDLEKRVEVLEQRLEGGAALQRWKDPILWRRIKKGMTTDDIKVLLGKPDLVEEQIFTTWYYHPTSKRHSFIWFDEDKTLGWTAPK